jgi:hypothetical protein
MQDIMQRTKSWWSESTPRKDWHVVLKLAGDEALEPPLAQDVLEMAYESLGGGSAEELSETAKFIQNEAAFESVKIIRTKPNQVIVSISRRKGVLCVQADHLRLMTALGSVYGRVNPEDCPGPIVGGVFANRDHPFILNTDMTVKLRTEERDAIVQAAQLFESAKAQNFEPVALDYQRFRGFSMTLKDSGTEVFVGPYPFEAHLQRLTKILSRLKQKGQVAQRIELDYQGKAFIKLRTPKKG